MAYSEILADRIRDSLVNQPNVSEKKMMGGLTFMVNNKMCVGIFRNELMCRIDPAVQDNVLLKEGCRIMDMKGRIMNGYLLVDSSAIESQKEFDEWIHLCLDFNERAKSSKKKK
jgi:TfoX/Sxy family transcriptional regulator of competence genes